MTALGTVPSTRHTRDAAWMLASLVAALMVPSTFGQGAVPVGGEFQINTYVMGDPYSPVVTTLADGSLVALWESAGSSGTDTDSTSIQGQRYTAGGMPVGEQFQVNTETLGIQSDPFETCS